MVYDWKQGTRYTVSAQKVAEELSLIGDQLTPTAVWKKAKVKTSAMHGCFTWDIETAARERWDEQARKLIRSIVIMPDEEEKEKGAVIIRAFECVTIDEDHRAYVPIAQVLHNADWRFEVFGNIRNAIDELVRKLRSYEAEGVEPVIGKVIQRVQSARELVLSQ